MNKKVEQTIIEISRKILYTYFVENQQDYLLSLLAKDIVFVGMGKYLKAEGKEEVYRLFDSGKEQMFPCSMNDELYLARPLGQDYWFCEAQCDLDTQPGLPLFFHECQRTTFIYRRNLQTENKLGWELVHLNNSIAWKQMRPRELFALSTAMKNYDLLQHQEQLSPPDLGALYDLIERGVYDKMRPETQELLQLLSVFDTFTTGQAEYMWQRGDAAVLLAEEWPRNSFLIFDVVQSQYRFHRTFAGFLKKLTGLRDRSWQKKQRKRATAWCLKTGWYTKALELGEEAGDGEMLLNAVELGGFEALATRPWNKRRDYLKKAPPTVRRKHLLAGVILDMDRWAHQSRSAHLPGTARAGTKIRRSVLVTAPALDEAAGYNQIRQGLVVYNDLAKMSACLSKACQLLPQGAPTLSVSTFLAMGSPSLLYLYHGRSGALEEELSQLKKLAQRELSQLDQCDASGMGEMMEAERLYFQGHLEGAEIKAFQVQELARRSHRVANMICAAFLQARMGLTKGSWDQVSYFLKQAEDYVKKDDQPWHRQALRLGTSYIYSLLGQQDRLAGELAGGVLPENWYQPLAPFFYLLFSKYLLLREEYSKLVGLFPMHYEAATGWASVMAQIYLSLFAAIAYLKLSHEERGMSLLQQSLSLARPDGIIMPFAEHMQYLDLPLKKLLAAGWETSFLRCIQKASLENEFLAMQQQLDQKSRSCSLTPREKELVPLLMAGLSNREMAAKLCLAEVTVKKALSNLYKKVGVKTRTSLIHYFYQQDGL